MVISFAQTQLGKPIDQITEADLISYFAVERDESLTLEFKSFAQREGDIKHKENGVLRTICGFMNSNGGLLIWGAPIGSTNSVGQKVFTGALSPVEKRYSKDDFISKISNRVIPFTAALQVQPIELSQGGFVYLIDVPESESKPHQLDNIYYIRLDGQTRPAPHYVIDALFKQIRRPELKGFLRVTYYRIYLTPNEGYNTIVLRFEVTVFNVTAAINDTDVYLQLSAETGTFVTGTDPGHIYGKGGRRVTILIQGGLITDSLPTKRSFGYQINTQELNDLPNQTFGVRLIFGSKNSTTKYSHYLIDPRPQVNLSPHEFSKEFTRPLDLNRLLSIDREENVSLSEKWQGKEDERLELGLSGI